MTATADGNCFEGVQHGALPDDDTSGVHRAHPGICSCSYPQLSEQFIRRYPCQKAFKLAGAPDLLSRDAHDLA